MSCSKQDTYSDKKPLELTGIKHNNKIAINLQKSENHKGKKMLIDLFKSANENKVSAYDINSQKVSKIGSEIINQRLIVTFENTNNDENTGEAAEVKMEVAQVYKIVSEKIDNTHFLAFYIPDDLMPDGEDRFISSFKVKDCEKLIGKKIEIKETNQTVSVYNIISEKEIREYINK